MWDEDHLGQEMTSQKSEHRKMWLQLKVQYFYVEGITTCTARVWLVYLYLHSYPSEGACDTAFSIYGAPICLTLQCGKDYMCLQSYSNNKSGQDLVNPEFPGPVAYYHVCEHQAKLVQHILAWHACIHHTTVCNKVAY